LYSGSVGANYIEANDCLGKKDFRMHSPHLSKGVEGKPLFLRLLDTGSVTAVETERALLVAESTELMKIFGAILKKSE
jgi:hypothetical protein